MTNAIRPGDIAIITHDIETAFKAGEQVVVEAISPDEQKPEFRYVVYSRTEMKRYRLSDADLVEPAPIMPPEVQETQSTANPATGMSTGKIIGIVLLVLLLVGGGVFAILYVTVLNDSGGEEVAPISTQPAVTESEPVPATEPKPAPQPGYGTVKVSDEQFEQAQNGMSYEQVQSLFGGPGKLLSETGQPGTPEHSTEYAWDGTDEGTAARCRFKDDKLVKKEWGE